MKTINDAISQISDNISILSKKVKYLETQSGIKTIIRSETGDPDSGINGQICINKVDNTAKIYVNNSWMDVATASQTISESGETPVNLYTLQTLGDFLSTAEIIVPDSNDYVPIMDTSASDIIRRMPWSNVIDSVSGEFVPVSHLTDYNPHGIDKNIVGLDQVDNTSDLNKPVSTAQQTALNLKADKTITISTTSPLYGGGDLSSNRTLSISAATESAKGAVELATAAETTTGTDNTRAVHPAGLKVELDKKVTGPSSATDNAVVRFDGTTGKLIQNSPGVTIDDNGNVNILGDLNAGNGVLFVDRSLANVGINTLEPDPQFALDVNGPARASYFIGPHALQLKDVIFLAHYDGNEQNTVAEFNDIKGQVAIENTNKGYVSIGDGKFGKAIFTQYGNYVNLITNPLFGNGTTGWAAWNCTASIVNHPVKYGDKSIRGNATNTGFSITGNGYSISGSTTGRTFTASCWVYVSDDLIGKNVSLYIRESGGAVEYSQGISSITAVAGWNYIKNTYTIVENDRTSTTAFAYVPSGAVAGTSWMCVNGFNFSERAYPAEFVAGGLPGCTWSGTEHNSTSTRTSNGYLTYNNPGIRNSGQSISFWINPTFYPGVYADAFYLKGTAGQVLLRIANSNNLITAWGSGQSTVGTPVYNSWTHIVMVSNGTNLLTYINGILANTYATPTPLVLTGSEKLYIGSGYADTPNRPFCGYIDDFVIVNHVMDADEVRAIYESNAPVFAESSMWSFRTAKSGLVWADEDGLWMKDSLGNAAFGVSGVNSKSWGGLTLDSGDLLIGGGTNYVKWDARPTPTLEIAGKVTALSGFIGNGSSGFTINNTSITNGKTSLTDANAGIYLGTDGIALGASSVFKVTNAGVLTAASATVTGTINANAGYLASLNVTGKLTMSGASSAIAIGTTPPTSSSAGTGLWIDRTGYYGLNAGTYQVKIDATDGKLYAGGGNVRLDSGGLYIKTAPADNYQSNRALSFISDGTISGGFAAGTLTSYLSSKEFNSGSYHFIGTDLVSIDSTNDLITTVSMNNSVYGSSKRQELILQSGYPFSVASGGVSTVNVYADYNDISQTKVHAQSPRIIVKSETYPLELYTKNTRGYLYVPLSSSYIIVNNQSNFTARYVDLSAAGVPNEAVAVDLRMTYSAATVGDNGRIGPSNSDYLRIVAYIQASNKWASQNGITPVSYNGSSHAQIYWNPTNATNITYIIVNGYFI